MAIEVVGGLFALGGLGGGGVFFWFFFFPAIAKSTPYPIIFSSSLWRT